MKARKQADMGFGVCQHDQTEEVKNYGGEIIAIRCSGCTTILCHVGICDGCGRNRKLTKAVQKTRKRYCTEDCYAQVMAKQREDRKVELEVRK